MVKKRKGQCTVELRENETVEDLIRRFKRNVIKAGILEEVKRREFFLKKSLKRKEKSKRARIRAIKEGRI